MIKIEIDNKSGFCFGVVNAIQKAEEELVRKHIQHVQKGTDNECFFLNMLFCFPLKMRRKVCLYVP